MKEKMNAFIYYFLQWTWGLIQNIIGLILFVYVCLKYDNEKVYKYHYAFVVEWESKKACMGLGMFIFMNKNHHHYKNNGILAHEYGHTIQSLILGPLFLFLIGLPSVIWANSKTLQTYRNKKNKSYYWFYCEKWANSLGKKYTREKVPEI